MSLQPNIELLLILVIGVLLVYLITRFFKNWFLLTSAAMGLITYSVYFRNHYSMVDKEEVLEFTKGVVDKSNLEPVYHILGYEVPQYIVAIMILAGLLMIFLKAAKYFKHMN